MYLFGDVVRLYLFGFLQVGDGTSDFEDLVMGAGAEAQFIDRLFEQVLSGLVEPAELSDLFAVHAGVGQQIQAGEAFGLSPPGAKHLFAHGGGTGTVAVAGQLCEGHGRYVHMDIDPVHQGTGDSAEVLFDLVWCTFAGSLKIRPIPAGTPVRYTT